MEMQIDKNNSYQSFSGEYSSSSEESEVEIENMQKEVINKDFYKKFYPFVDKITQSQYILQWMKDNKHMINAISPSTKRNDFSKSVGIFAKSTKKYGHYCFQNNYKLCKEFGGLLEIITPFQKIVKKVLKDSIIDILKFLINGGKMTQFPFPIQVFEKISYLEIYADIMCGFSYYLERAANIFDPLEQMKLSATFLIAFVQFGWKPGRPFNPLWGETYQCEVNGYPFYAEQVSYQPAMTAALLYGKGFRLDLMDKSLDNIKFGLNSFTLSPKGRITVNYFKTKNQIHAKVPHKFISNLLLGKTRRYNTNHLYLMDPQNQLFADITFNYDNFSMFASNKGKYYDKIKGHFYRVKKSFIAKNLKVHIQEKDTIEFKPKRDAIKMLSTIEGRYLETIRIDRKLYFTFNKDFPYQTVQSNKKLPSDSCYRKDINYYRSEDLVKAQKFKNIYEEEQRRYKKLREDKRYQKSW